MNTQIPFEIGNYEIFCHTITNKLVVIEKEEAKKIYPLIAVYGHDFEKFNAQEKINGNYLLTDRENLNEKASTSFSLKELKPLIRATLANGYILRPELDKIIIVKEKNGQETFIVPPKLGTIKN
jgi:hypothetical protein